MIKHSVFEMLTSLTLTNVPQRCLVTLRNIYYSDWCRYNAVLLNIHGVEVTNVYCRHRSSSVRWQRLLFIIGRPRRETEFSSHRLMAR